MTEPKIEIGVKYLRYLGHISLWDHHVGVADVRWGLLGWNHI